MLSLVVAMADNRVIGRDNQLPWHIPADLKHFKANTMGKPMIMGRKTFESLGRVLPGRPHIVISRNLTYPLPGGDCHLVPDMATAIEKADELAGGKRDAVVIGGAQIYEQALAIVDVLHVTWVHLEAEGDTWFPEIDFNQWYETSRADHADQNPAYSFVSYQRINQ